MKQSKNARISAKLKIKKGTDLLQQGCSYNHFHPNSSLFLLQNNAGVEITGTEYGNPLANTSILGPRDEDFLASLKAYNEERGLSVAMESEELEGANRVAADGFLTDEECEAAIHMAEVSVWGRKWDYFLGGQFEAERK